MPLFLAPLFNMVTGEGSGFYDYECRLLGPAINVPRCNYWAWGTGNILCVRKKEHILALPSTSLVEFT